MVTLKDVAERAKVSLTTVSYALNNNPLIPEKTKQKVLQAAKELNYRPNGIAKNLKKQKTNIIGLFIVGFSGPFFNDMMSGVQEVVIEKGYELMVCASQDKHRLLVEHYVDGAIILNFHMKDDLIKNVSSKKFPLVVMDREIENPYVKNVLIPNKRGAAMAVNHLIEKGHQRIGFIAGSSESYDGEKRLSGFKEELERQNISVLEKDIIRAGFTEISGYEEMDRYLKKENDYPSAFICANDEMAIGAMRAIKESGLKVPGDIAIIGFDDINVSRYLSPALTTIRVQRKEWGIIAANTLFRMLENEFNFEVEETQVELICRNSG